MKNGVSVQWERMESASKNGVVSVVGTQKLWTYELWDDGVIMPNSCRKLEIILEYGIAAGETPNAKVNRRCFICFSLMSWSTYGIHAPSDILMVCDTSQHRQYTFIATLHVTYMYLTTSRTYWARVSVGARHINDLRRHANICGLYYFAVDATWMCIPFDTSNECWTNQCIKLGQKRAVDLNFVEAPSVQSTMNCKLWNGTYTHAHQICLDTYTYVLDELFQCFYCMIPWIC